MECKEAAITLIQKLNTKFHYFLLKVAQDDFFYYNYVKKEIKIFFEIRRMNSILTNPLV